jgi:hypothetical protein
VSGYGSSGQDFYLSPLGQPLAFLAALPTRLLSVIGELFLGTKAYWWIIPQRHLLAVLAGVAGLAVCGLLLWPAWKSAAAADRRRINWLAAGTVGAIVPLAARVPSSHVMVIPFIGGALLLAVIFGYWSQRLRQLPMLPTLIGAAACLPLLYIHLVSAPLTWFNYSRDWHRGYRHFTAFHAETILNELAPHHRAIFLNFNPQADLFHGFYYRKLYRLAMPFAWWPLTVSDHGHRYRRTDDRTLELEMVGGCMLDSLLEGAIRSRALPFRVGEVTQLPGLRVTILALGRTGPSRIQFRFRRSLDHDSYRLLAWQHGRLVALSPPPVGSAILLSPRSARPSP